MKGRESGMPEKDFWNTFFRSNEIIKKLVPESSRTGDLAEFGAGYGTFTIPAIEYILGNIYAIDIDRPSLDILSKNVSIEQRKKIQIIERDFVENGTGLDAASCTHVMLYNILHIENPHILATEAYRILKVGMSASVIHWRSDIETPRGPSLNIRPKQDDCKRIMETVGFKMLYADNLNQAAPYHYGMIFIKGE